MSTTKAEGKVLQYLYEAHATEVAMAQTLGVHIAMTPSGSYRQILERHRRETRGHAERVRNRLREIEQRRAIVELAMDASRLGIGLLQAAVGQVMATAKAPLDILRGGLSGEEKVLKNAKDECAGEALEIATYDAIEELSAQVGDHETMRLAASIREDEVRFLNQLFEHIPALTDAVVDAEFGHGTYRLSRTGAAQAAREAARSAQRRVRRTGEALEAAGREAGEAAGAAGSEAAEAAEAAGRKAQRGAQRAARELDRGAARTAARGREAASRARSSGSGTASRRSAASRSGHRNSTATSPTRERREPWPGYDEQRVDEITERLERDDARKAEQVREYESQHRDRTGVIQAAEKEAQKENQATGEGQSDAARKS